MTRAFVRSTATLRSQVRAGASLVPLALSPVSTPDRAPSIPCPQSVAGRNPCLPAASGIPITAGPSDKETRTTD